MSRRDLDHGCLDRRHRRPFLRQPRKIARRIGQMAERLGHEHIEWHGLAHGNEYSPRIPACAAASAELLTMLRRYAQELSFVG